MTCDMHDFFGVVFQHRQPKLGINRVRKKKVQAVAPHTIAILTVVLEGGLSGGWVRHRRNKNVCVASVSKHSIPKRLMQLIGIRRSVGEKGVARAGEHLIDQSLPHV